VLYHKADDVWNARGASRTKRALSGGLDVAVPNVSVGATLDSNLQNNHEHFPWRPDLLPSARLSSDFWLWDVRSFGAGEDRRQQSSS